MELKCECPQCGNKETITVNEPPEERPSCPKCFCDYIIKGASN